MASNAADLQRMHSLEGAPDPFPSLPEAGPFKPIHPSSSQSETAFDADFPSLAPSANVPPTQPAWGVSSGPRIKPTVVKQSLYSDSFTLSAIDLSSAGRDGKAATLGEVMKLVMSRYKVKLDASGNQKNRQTTFHLKAESKKELEKAKRSLLSLLSPVVTVILHAPASTIPAIIGPKGATLKQIRDQTNVKVDIPKKETNGNGHANGINSGTATPSQDDAEEEATVPITLHGYQLLVLEAQALLKEIIASKTSIVTQRIRDIPPHVLPLVRVRRSNFIAAAQGVQIQLGLNEADREITVHGDREAVGRVLEVIKDTIDGFNTVLTSVKLTIPKRQHRLLMVKATDQILVKSKCAIIVPRFDDPSEEITVWGQSVDLPGGLSAVMEQANSKYIHELPLHGPPAISKQLVTYMTRVQYPKVLEMANPGVSVHIPSSTSFDKGTDLNIVIVGEKPIVDAMIGDISGMLGRIEGAIKEVSIDWLLHRVITGKNSKKVKQFHDTYNVLIFVPPESAEQSTILLVYDPQSPSASSCSDEKKKNLDIVESELLKMVDVADVSSQSLHVEKRWHEAILGPNGTTLNAIIGEDIALSIKVGVGAGNPDTEDIILVRGISSDVNRAIKDILKIVEDAKNDEIVSSYVTEFEIEKEYVGRIVGAQGVGVNKLREQLAVKVDFYIEAEEKEKESRKKKAVQKSKVKITGRKENVEDAKRRIQAQVERLADETSVVLNIPNEYHASLIGQYGKYVLRLEEKYEVKITFPRSTEGFEGKTREQLKPDEVLVKGGKKGVAGAKSELVDAYEFEKESNHVLKFAIPTRAVARVLGKSGASINEIEDNTGAQIDIDKVTARSEVTSITVRGTKEATDNAKASILAIAEQVKEETTVVILIENKYHRTIIGAGGQGLRDIFIRCGEPSDPRQQTGLIRFPRPDDPSDEVKLRGEPPLVAKMQSELEKIVASLRERIVVAVNIPASQHRALIGRGGQNLSEIQSKSGAQIQFPGSRSYHQIGEAENSAEFADADPADIVKVAGNPDTCKIAIDLLKDQAAAEITDDVVVPLKYHHAIGQQGAFFRDLRSFGVHVEQSVQPTRSGIPAKPLNSGPSARIDDTAESAPEPQWEVIPNYQDAEEGDSTWTIKARDQASLERAKTLVQEAIQHAQDMSHVGFLTLPDHSLFPRIVGAKGSNVIRLRNETGTDITLNKEDTTIVIIGTESNIEAAKDAILEMGSNGGRPQRRK
ncbi:hypothetical protein APHAL10511_003720 [Amanita phalloides]|nr:hypothetical protein APHAL10511_003720 [Amanita phalloides]